MVEVKYNIGDKIRTKIHYQNDKRSEVEAVIRGIDLDDEDNIKYKIRFEPDDVHKRQEGAHCTGYVKQDDIIELCQDGQKSVRKDDTVMTKRKQFVYVDDLMGAINKLPNNPNGFSAVYDKARIVRMVDNVPKHYKISQKSSK